MATNSFLTRTSSFNDLPVHFLYPAAIFVKKSPYIISTILGSCVAVCLWDKKLKYGGMNHYLLPLWNGQGLASPKFGSIAIEKLVEKMVALGSDPKHIQAKVFGGGEVIKTSINHFNIGNRNIEIAHSILKDFKIPIISENTGGKQGRKILMNTTTGEIRMKFIPNHSL